MAEVIKMAIYASQDPFEDYDKLVSDSSVSIG